MFTPRILVADDLPDKLKYLARLTRENCPRADIIMATSATEATGLSELFGRGGIQILVTDFDLENGKHGGDVAEEVKSLNPEVKIICATARTDEALKEAEAASPVADQTVSIHQADFEERFRDFFALAA